MSVKDWFAGIFSKPAPPPETAPAPPVITLPAELIAPMPPTRPNEAPGATEATQTTADTLRVPTGPIRARPPWGGAFGIDWERITRFLPELIAANAKYPRVSIPLGASMIVIESGGLVNATNCNDGSGVCSFGLMQVKPKYWQHLEPTANVMTAAGGILLGFAVMDYAIRQHGSWQEAIKKTYHPGTDPTSGANPDTYVRAITDLMAEWPAAQPGPDPEPPATITFGRVPHPPFQDRPITKPAGQGWDDLGQRSPKGVVLHRMIGTLDGTDSYFRLPSTKALTDYGVGVLATDGASRDGVLYRWNDPLGRRSGWASGPVDEPYGDGKAFVDKYTATAVNRDLISIEISGQYATPLSDKAFETIAQLTAYWADQCKVPHTSFPTNPATGISFVFWHQEFTIGTGKICPGQVVMDATSDLIARAKSLLQKAQTGTVTPPPPPKPKYPGLVIPDAVFEALFLDPSIAPDPAGPFTKFMVERPWFHPVHSRVILGSEVYLITGGGVLRYKDGKVEKL